jgi:predicted nucleic acid-binding protein
MICIDTSVWIEFFRGSQKTVQKMNSLLDNEIVGLPQPVYLEILSGLRKNEHKTISRVLSALPRLYPNSQSWELCEVWVVKGRKKGLSFGVTDVIIASLAAVENAILWAFDSDFQDMEKLKFIKLLN